jgi:hypothetical protein
VDRAGLLVSQPDEPDALTTARHRLHRHSPDSISYETVVQSHLGHRITPPGCA